MPAGYTLINRAAVLGRGDSVFHSARDALREWGPFRVPWMRVFAQAAPDKGVLVAVAVHLLGTWWTNVSRVIYSIDEPNVFGFAYGTLPQHAETGEERFLVEQSPTSGEVTYRIQAFSQPRHPLAKLGYPLARATQRRFGRDSIDAMKKAVVGCKVNQATQGRSP